MKLSEAIRLGASLSPRCTGSLFRDGKTCALGAALEAIGKNLANYDALFSEWPWLNEVKVLEIAKLNDCSGWSCDQIADYVATIEQKSQWNQSRRFPMFICGICKKSSRAGEKARRITTKWREVFYPRIPNAHRYQNQEGVWKTKDDPGGVGMAVLKEIMVCGKHLLGYDIDTSDIPEVKDWSRAVVGKFYRTKHE